MMNIQKRVRTQMMNRQNKMGSQSKEEIQSTKKKKTRTMILQDQPKLQTKPRFHMKRQRVRDQNQMKNILLGQRRKTTIQMTSPLP